MVSKIFLQGFKARLESEFARNPFNKSSKRYKEWLDGFDTCDSELDLGGVESVKSIYRSLKNRA